MTFALILAALSFIGFLVVSLPKMLNGGGSFGN
jgi:hypothetical protein